MITIICFDGSSFVSDVIKFVEGSNISHCGIGLDINGDGYVLQATWGGVQLTPRATVLQSDAIVAEFAVLPNVSGEVEAAEARIGQAYDYLTVFGYLFVLLGRDLHIGINNPFYSKSSEVCSEFVIEVDTLHEITEFDGLDPADITPEDLYNICLNGKSFKKL